jgi:hypothetical protein
MGKTLSPEESHERSSKRLSALIERLQRALAADGLPEEDSEKIDHLIAPEAPPRKMHTLSDVDQNIVRGVDTPPSTQLPRTMMGLKELTGDRFGW